MATNKPPRRNLPPASEPWGRYVDNEMTDLRSELRNSVTNINASIAANASSMTALSQQIANQMTSSMAQTTTTTYGLGSTFADIISVSLDKPEWATRCLLFVTGFCSARVAGSGSSSLMAYVRAVAHGNNGPSVIAMPHAANAAGTVTNSTAQASWSSQITNLTEEDTSVTASVQMRADAPAMYPSSSGSNAAINVIALWMR